MYKIIINTSSGFITINGNFLKNGVTSSSLTLTTAITTLTLIYSSQLSTWCLLSTSNNPGI